MNAAARLHQRNIYCIIYSVPWFRENTYKLPAMLYPMHTLSCLPFKAVACSCPCFILHFSRPWDTLLGHCLWYVFMADPNRLKGLLQSAQCQLEDVHSSVSGQYSDEFMATSDYSTWNQLPSDGRPKHRPSPSMKGDAWRIGSIEDNTAARPATRAHKTGERCLLVCRKGLTDVSHLACGELFNPGNKRVWGMFTPLCFLSPVSALCSEVARWLWESNTPS